MSDEATEATAESLRADFLNATTTHQRWKVLNRAIDWAVVASENADGVRHRLQVALAEVEAAKNKGQTVTLALDSTDLVSRVLAQARMHTGGTVRGTEAPERVGEATQGSARLLRAGDIVTCNADEEGWIVEVVRRDGWAAILPLGDDYALRRTVVAIQDVWPLS